MPKTVLTPEQLKEAVKLGNSTEVRELANDGYSFEDIKEILETQRAARIEERAGEVAFQADANAKANKKLTMPENTTHPHVSAFSYPEGDIARPRPVLKCPMYWLNELVEHDQSTAKELELFNQLQPGRYRCERPDGSPMQVDVIVENDAISGKWHKLTVSFATKGGLHRNLSTRVTMLKEILEQQSALVLA